ncbi:hypothetical protein [Nocardia sp. NPDC004260]
MTAKVIGFLRKDLAAYPQREETTIRELAEQVGYTVVETLTPGEETEPETGTWLLAKIHGHRLAAVIIADQRYIPPPMMDEITAVCGVVTPLQIIPAHVQNPEG